MKHQDDAHARAAFALLTTFGLGHLRPAPGTWGSLPPVALAAACIALDIPDAASTAILLSVCVVFTLACAAVGHLAEARYARKDPGDVVADETAGQSLPLIAVVWLLEGLDARGLLVLAVAFLGFRAFDIVKVPPARQLQEIPGGWGIVLDDLAAGAYAVVLTIVLAMLV